MEELKFKGYIEEILTYLGVNIKDPNFEETPQRILKMWKNDFCANIGKEFTDFKVFPNEKNYNQMITSEEITFSSVCGHHFVNFSGKAWLGYIPNDYLIGKSKISRLVKFYCKKPQIQEELTDEILNAFVENVKPKGAMLIMKAVHNCEYCRGSRTYAPMTTSAIFGSFDQDKTRSEFLSLLKLKIG